MAQDNTSGQPGNDNIAPVDFSFYSSYLAYQTPVGTSFVAALHGLGRGPLTGAFTYAQVGLGDMAALSVMAECYPEAQFIGLDADAGAAERGQALPREAALPNVTIKHGALTGEDLPECDLIVLARLYSSLDPATRQTIVQGLAKRLKPGGLLCVQYSCLPGAASTDALFNFLREVAGTLEGPPPQRVAGAMARAIDLARGEAFLFRQLPSAAEILQRMTQSDPVTCAREVLNTPPHALYVTQVMREMAPTGLVYAGHGQIPMNLLEIGLPQALRAGAEAVKEIPARELYLDYARNSQARIDVYARPLKDGPSDPANLLADFLIRRVTAGPETLRRQQIAQNTGVDFTAGLYTDLLNAISPEPRSIASVLEEPAMRKHARARAIKAIQLMVGAEMIQLVRAKYAVETDALPDKLRMISKLNTLLLKANLDTPEIVPFSSPVTGQRFLLTLAQRLNLFKLLGGDLETAYASLEQRGLQVTDKDGKRASLEEFKATIEAELQKFRLQGAPYLRVIGVIAEEDVQ